MPQHCWQMKLSTSSSYACSCTARSLPPGPAAQTAFGPSTDLGCREHQLGNSASAVQLHSTVLERRQQVLGDRHPDTAEQHEQPGQCNAGHGGSTQRRLSCTGEDWR